MGYKDEGGINEYYGWDEDINKIDHWKSELLSPLFNPSIDLNKKRLTSAVPDL